MGVYKNNNGNLQLISGATLYADAPVGSISAFGGSTAPNGWLLCQGQAVSRTTYAELFSIIGTAFGSGDGSTTFNIPDLRGEFLRGAGTNSHTNQGNGGNVGGHQDATVVSNSYYNLDNTGWTRFLDPNNPIDLNGDATLMNTGKQLPNSGGQTATFAGAYSVRPTNTSVNYIIKAKQVALPLDIQIEVDKKQDITDNTLQTVSKTVPGAINEINDNLTDISTDGTIKTVIWQDSNIQENLDRNVPFVMPEDGYVVARAGAANNYSTTMLTLVITINNSLRVAEILLEEPYAEATISTPYLKKGTQVNIAVIMSANAWTSDTRGTVNFTII